MKLQFLMMLIAALTLFCSSGCISQIQNDSANFTKAIEKARCLEEATQSSECVEEANYRFYLDESEAGQSETSPELERPAQTFRNVHSDVL